MAEKFPNLMKTIIPWSQEVKKKNSKHKKQRKQSNCLHSVKKKILKATRGGKTLWTKNRATGSRLDKNDASQKTAEERHQRYQTVMQNSIPSKNITQK